MPVSAGARAAAAFGAAFCAAAPALAVDGAPDRSTSFAVAVAEGSPSNPEFRCSGVLIDAGVVLTVRHCVVALPETDSVDCARDRFGDPLLAPDQLWVSAAPRVLPAAGWHAVESWVLPRTSRVCGADLALLLLERPIPLSEASPAQPVVGSAAFAHALAQGVLGAVGYGVTGAGAADAGTRRARWDVGIRCVPGDPRFSCEGQVPVTDFTEFVSGPGTCTGDSGSGAIDVVHRESVFALLSRGELLGTSCSDAVYLRTDAWSWLIGKTVINAALARGAAAPVWALDLFPPPGTVARDGEFCLNHGDCREPSRCLSSDDSRTFVCAAPCASSGACAAGFSCVAGPPGAFCFAAARGEEPERTSSCSTPGRIPSVRGSGWLVIGAAAVGVRRRRRVTARRR